MIFKKGDRVRYREEALAPPDRRKAVGTVREVFGLPANGVRVAVQWAPKQPEEPGILADVLELVPEP
jgi:hypothetical protein